MISQTQVRVNVPVRVSDLAKFLGAVSEEAELTVVQHEGGSQRDPVVTGYTFVARWEL